MRPAMRDRRRSSYTAEAAASARAYGAMNPDPLLRGPDHLAIRFLGAFFRFVLLPGIRNGFLEQYERRGPGVFFHHQARTKYIDGILRAELAAGAKQIVLLGAGFDTRAYRFADALVAANARLFEVDHPATSAMKQKRVKRLLGALPRHVTYVPVNFLQDVVEERLAASGYDRAQVTLFIWEGVTPYLDSAAIDGTLAMVARAAKGSSITFDYTFASALANPDAALKKQLDLAAKAGEPYAFGVGADGVKGLLERHGLTLVEDVSAEEAETRFLVGSDGKRWGRVCPVLATTHGRV
jgi:methyltransferase (TIGR00027 family)